MIGPARDGGYCLVGMTGAFRRLFAAMPWGTDMALHLAYGHQAFSVRRNDSARIARFEETIMDDTDYHRRKR